MAEPFFSFDIGNFFQAFVLLFSILNALGNVPILISLTSGNEEKRGKIVNQSVVIALLILTVFAYVGWLIFQFFGITIADFKIAGGIILFFIAYDNLKGEVYRPKEIKVEEIAAFPLATPLLAGPAAISTVIILSNPPYGPLLALFVIALNMLVAWIILRQSDLIQRAG